MDDEKAKFVYSMSQTKGWQVLKELIGKRLRSLRNNLEGNDFDNVGEVKRLQGEIKANREILNDVEKYSDKYLEGGK